MPARSSLADQVAEVLGPHGIISRRLPGYESRPAQVAMAEVVATAIESGRHAVVEGGTGVGKSLAYLVPAIYSGKKVIVSTANKALQDQLVTKDIPFLQHALPRDVSAALVKGRSNYLCLDRLDDEDRFQTLAGGSRDYQALKLWSATTESGDFEELTALRARDLLGRVGSTSRTCIGSACDYYHDCFVERMRARADKASVVVCNHALLMADLVLRDMGGRLLPDRDVVVVDEAHRLEEAALSALSVGLSRRGIADWLDSVLLRRYAGEPGLATIGRLADDLFRPFELRTIRNRSVVHDELGAGLRLADKLWEVAQQLHERNPFPASNPTRESRHYEKLVEWTTRLAEDARLVSRANDEDSVRYVEQGPVGRPADVAVTWTPVDVGDPLGELLFRHTPVICTSATLAVGDFGYFRRAVGIGDAAEFIAPSPFDYAEQCLLYVPRHLPEFRGAATPEYAAAQWQEIEALVRAARGRAFILFTSRRALDDAHDALHDRLPFTVLKQGAAPRGELLRRFRADGSAVLFATKSFWEGVDVAGDALSLVVIDRMPFSVPDDPIVAARVDRLKRDGDDWFNGLMLPNAILQLKQGVGRLIRTRRDRGVVAILDSRIARKPYGRKVLAALPPARVAYRLSEVQHFFTLSPHEMARDGT